MVGSQIGRGGCEKNRRVRKANAPNAVVEALPRDGRSGRAHSRVGAVVALYAVGSCAETPERRLVQHPPRRLLHAHCSIATLAKRAASKVASHSGLECERAQTAPRGAPARDLLQRAGGETSVPEVACCDDAPRHTLNEHAARVAQCWNHRCIQELLARPGDRSIGEENRRLLVHRLKRGVTTAEHLSVQTAQTKGASWRNIESRPERRGMRRTAPGYRSRGTSPLLARP